MNDDELREFLDEKVLLYNRPDFIESDPIQVPHRFTKREDIEIAGFLAATIAWGNRKMIIRNALLLMERMDESPYDFVMSHSNDELNKLLPFVHRTFNGTDLIGFVTALRHIYQFHGGPEQLFSQHSQQQGLQYGIHHFKSIFCQYAPETRTHKHVSDPLKNSAAKRINMFLRWMVRKDQAGVDFGIWDKISPSLLSCPLDVHSGNVARKLGLLTRKQNDAKALAELDGKLRILDPKDPARYDFALFGLGVFEKF